MGCGVIPPYTQRPFSSLTQKGRVLRIIAVCARLAELSVDEFLSSRRNTSIVLPRWIAMHFSARLTRLSICEISELFGGLDRTTIAYGVDKVRQQIKTDVDFAAAVAAIEAKITGGAM
jgi:chromosomal replication initiator protein